MAVDHVSKPLVRLEPLPLKACAPIVEEAPRPALAPVIPQLSKRLLQDISGIQTLVGGQQQREQSLAVQGEIVVVRQQRVFLTLDEASVVAAQPGIFGLAHLVERLAEM